MSPTCEPQPLPLTADEINQAIRAYLQPRTGRPLHNDEAAEYGRRRDAWVTATRAEVAKAASSYCSSQFRSVSREPMPSLSATARGAAVSFG